jgi:predicted transcriptional regulator
MLAKDASIHRDIYCTSDTPLQTVFQILVDNNCACVPIVESLAHKNPIGSVSERDICLKTIVEGLNPQRVTAARVMNGNFTTVSGEASIDGCVRLLRESDAGRLFVIDEEGAFGGIIFEESLVLAEPEATARGLLNGSKAGAPAGRELHLAF